MTTVPHFRIHWRTIPWISLPVTGDPSAKTCKEETTSRFIQSSTWRRSTSMLTGSRRKRLVSNLVFDGSKFPSPFQGLRRRLGRKRQSHAPPLPPLGRTFANVGSRQRQGPSPYVRGRWLLYRMHYFLHRVLRAPCGVCVVICKGGSYRRSHFLRKPVMFVIILTR